MESVSLNTKNFHCLPFFVKIINQISATAFVTLIPKLTDQSHVGFSMCILSQSVTEKQPS